MRRLNCRGAWAGIGAESFCRKLVERRTTTPAREAVYSLWIELDAADPTTEFDALGIPHGIATLSKLANEELWKLTTAMEDDLKSGRFDLSKAPEADCVWRANEYVERNEQIWKLRDQLLSLEIVAGAQPEAQSPAGSTAE